MRVVEAEVNYTTLVYSGNEEDQTGKKNSRWRQYEGWRKVLLAMTAIVYQTIVSVLCGKVLAHATLKPFLGFWTTNVVTQWHACPVSSSETYMSHLALSQLYTRKSKFVGRIPLPFTSPTPGSILMGYLKCVRCSFVLLPLDGQT